MQVCTQTSEKNNEVCDKRPINKICGPGIEVQIDESKLGKVKYHRGHRVEGVWVFGMVEKTPERRIILVEVDNRKRETLEALLTKYVHPESVIPSDFWKAYTHLSSIFSSHKTINCSRAFKDPETGVNTNTIEGNWTGVKSQASLHNVQRKVSILI